jgi:hypothetical protein
MPWPATGSDGISIAPALDNAVAVIIVALLLRRASLRGTKTSRKTPAVHTTAMITVSITGNTSLRRSFLRACISFFRVIRCVIGSSTGVPFARRHPPISARQFTTARSTRRLIADPRETDLDSQSADSIKLNFIWCSRRSSAWLVLLSHFSRRFV